MAEGPTAIPNRHHVLVRGILGVLVGLAALLWPPWAIVTGAMQIVGAIRSCHEMTGDWLLAVSGALSVAFGLLVFIFPGAGAVTIAWMFGAFAAASP